jgi:transketolase
MLVLGQIALNKHMEVIDSNNYRGSYVHYGVRKHALAVCMNGMALHGGILPYGGTFLVFSDYCRPAIRLSALMKQQVRQKDLPYLERALWELWWGYGGVGGIDR